MAKRALRQPAHLHALIALLLWLPRVVAAEEPVDVATAPAAAVEALAAPPTAAFEINEFMVRGNTVLGESEIDQALDAFLGADKTAGDLEAARAALESTYAARGFKTVSVALARFSATDGIVLLEVSEGRIGHLKVVGSKYSSIDKIKRSAPSLAEGSVPNFNDVPRDIGALNQLADRRVTPELRAGAKPGTVDVDLDVVDHLPLHGSLELNNRYSQDTHPLRANASLSYDNLWQAGHSLALSAQVAPQHTPDARVFYGSYLARFGNSPWSVLANVIRSNSNVATVGGTDVVGNGTTVSIQATNTLTATDTFYHALSVGVALKHFNNDTSIAGTENGSPTRIANLVPLIYMPFTLGYTAIWRAPNSVTQADLSFNFANPQWGSDQTQFDNNRYGATGQQLYLRASATHTRDMPLGVQVMLRLSGQVTDQPLVNTEQFSAGGVDTVRGYYEAEALGDKGVGGTLEIRTPSVGQRLSLAGGHPIDDWRFFVFFDTAYLRLVDPLPEQAEIYRLASFGAGFNLKMFSFVNANLTFADPIRAGPGTGKWSSRYLFRVWTSF